jgi:hypothetical protein
MGVKVSAAFHLPLNLPHAAKVSTRLVFFMERWCSSGILRPTAESAHARVWELGLRICGCLAPCLDEEDNPPDMEAQDIARRVSDLGRALVQEVEFIGLGDDRFGQAVRNLFECLSRGQEGAALSLRAGENPDSPLRP